MQWTNILYFAVAAFISPACLASTLHNDPSDYIEIQRTLAKFALAVDSHDYSLLDEVFAPNVTATLQIPSDPVQGLAAIQNYLLYALNNTISQHNFGTQLIDIGTDRTSAHVVTYIIGTFVGTGGEKAGKSQITHAKYIDSMIRYQNHTWRVNERTLIFMVRLLSSSPDIFHPQNMC